MKRTFLTKMLFINPRGKITKSVGANSLKKKNKYRGSENLNYLAFNPKTYGKNNGFYTADSKHNRY